MINLYFPWRQITRRGNKVIKMLHIFQSLQKCIFCILEIPLLQTEKSTLATSEHNGAFSWGRRGVNKLQGANWENCQNTREKTPSTISDHPKIRQYLTTQKVDLDNFSRKTFRLIVQSCNFLYIWIPLVYPELTCFWEFSRISVVGIIWWVVGGGLRKVWKYHKNLM